MTSVPMARATMTASRIKKSIQELEGFDWDTTCEIINEALREHAQGERDRILAIVDEEASHYSHKEEMVKPSIVTAVFVNSLKAKVNSSETR